MRQSPDAVEVRVDFDRHGIIESVLPFGRPLNGMVLFLPDAAMRVAVSEFLESLGVIRIKPYTHKERHVPVTTPPSPTPQEDGQ